ncbi:hypothetical protein [Hymenobacter ruber]
MESVDSEDIGFSGFSRPGNGCLTWAWVLISVAWCADLAVAVVVLSFGVFYRFFKGQSACEGNERPL